MQHSRFRPYISITCRARSRPTSVYSRHCAVWSFDVGASGCAGPEAVAGLCAASVPGAAGPCKPCVAHLSTAGESWCLHFPRGQPRTQAAQQFAVVCVQLQGLSAVIAAHRTSAEASQRLRQSVRPHSTAASPATAQRRTQMSTAPAAVRRMNCKTRTSGDIGLREREGGSDHADLSAASDLDGQTLRQGAAKSTVREALCG